MEPTRSLLEDGQTAGRVASPSRQEPGSASKKPVSFVRRQFYRSPHEAKSISGSNSRLVKGLAARIQLHCAPNHNWESRRKDLRDSVRTFPCCHSLQLLWQLGLAGRLQGVHDSEYGSCRRADGKHGWHKMQSYRCWRVQGQSC